MSKRKIGKKKIPDSTDDQLQTDNPNEKDSLSDRPNGSNTDGDQNGETTISPWLRPAFKNTIFGASWLTVVVVLYSILSAYFLYESIQRKFILSSNTPDERISKLEIDIQDIKRLHSDTKKELRKSISEAKGELDEFERNLRDNNKKLERIISEKEDIQNEEERNNQIASLTKEIQEIKKQQKTVEEERHTTEDNAAKKISDSTNNDSNEHNLTSLTIHFKVFRHSVQQRFKSEKRTIYQNIHQQFNSCREHTNENMRNLQTDLNAKTTSLQSETKKLEQKVQTNISNVEGALRKELLEKFEYLNIRIDTMKDKFTTNISTLDVQLKGNITEVRSEINRVETDAKNSDKRLNTKIESTESTLLFDFGNKKRDLERQLKEIERQTTQNTKTLKLKIESTENELRQDSDKKAHVLDEQTKTVSNMFLAKETFWLVVGIYGIVFLIFLVMFIIDRKYQRRRKSTYENKSFVPSFKPNVSILDKVERRPLRDEVCIVSFYTETQALHRRLTESSIQTHMTDIKTSFVDKHENILNIPPSKIILIFVDFNERNIILEDPERELGDLKRTTVQAANKIGGDVFVIYVRESGSKNLPDGQLFNTRLTSVYNHADLSALNRKERVLSTYEDFSPYQKRHISTAISRAIKIRT